MSDIELFEKVCRTCGRKFFCENNCGTIGKAAKDRSCECKFCHAKTVSVKGHSCEERIERNKYLLHIKEKVQFT